MTDPEKLQELTQRLTEEKRQKERRVRELKQKARMQRYNADLIDTVTQHMKGNKQDGHS